MKTPVLGLEGKVAIVTGAAAGLGRAFAGALAGHGARVAALDRDRGGIEATIEESHRGAGAKIVPYEVDVTSSAQVDATIRKVLDSFGQIDIVVNNVGIYPITPFMDISEELFDRVLSVNLRSVYLVCRAVIPHMVTRRYGRIVNIATTGFYRPGPGQAHYAASKGGVIGLSRALAAEFGNSGITVNCVAPGLTMTATVEEAYPEARIVELVRARAISRRENVEDVVGAVLFLCSDLSAFMTGQTVVVDGGRIMS
ncbi:MAG: SDR family oxidoreductase [Candidatus Rokubacteria bacterium]|nr:SDR family oxidoreductase [Candidatus Rokubacteria bacterium]